MNIKNSEYLNIIVIKSIQDKEFSFCFSKHLKRMIIYLRYKRGKMVDTTALASGLSTYQDLANLLGVSLGAAIVIFAVISIWALVWKGIALWKSSKKNHLIWFIILLIVNTLGILEILYIFIFSKMSLRGKRAREKPAPKNKRR